MKPLKPDPRFDHVSYHETNLAKTFARIRRDLQRKADEQAREIAEREAETAKIVVGFERRR